MYFDLFQDEHRWLERWAHFLSPLTYFACSSNARKHCAGASLVKYWSLEDPITSLAFVFILFRYIEHAHARTRMHKHTCTPLLKLRDVNTNFFWWGIIIRSSHNPLFLLLLLVLLIIIIILQTCMTFCFCAGMFKIWHSNTHGSAYYQ